MRMVSYMFIILMEIPRTNGLFQTMGPVGPTGPQGTTGATNPSSGVNIQLTDGFYTNDQALNSNKTLSGSLNGGVFGPYEIASGVTLTISSGATFTVI